MAANVMLSRRGIDSTLYLGVKMDKANALTAHAWLRSGLKWVTGTAARRGQTVVACFAKIDTTSVFWSTRFRIMTLLCILVGLAVLTLMPFPPLHDLAWEGRPDWLRKPIHDVGSRDVWFNFAGFTVASLVFNFSLYGRKRASFRYRLPGIVSFILIFSILEFFQIALPERNFDPVDIAMGLLAVFAVFPFWFRSKD